MSMRNSAPIPGTYYIVRRTMQYRNLDSQSIQCLAALGEIKKKKKEKQIMNLLPDAMSRSIPPETTSAGQSSVRGSGAVHTYSESAPALSFVLWL